MNAQSTIFKTVFGSLVLLAMMLTPEWGWGQIAAWDFTGVGTSSLPTYAATTFNSNLVSASGANYVTRGSTAAWSTGGNSFRTVGFKNEGISTDNTDYFQITLTAATGYQVSLSTIDAKFGGTATFYASPGVTSQFAYSLNGTTFTLIGSPVQSTSLTMTQISLTGVTALQNVAAGTTITLRYYASGQTITGGWGFQSAATAGTNGLAIGGTVAATGALTPPTLTADVTNNNVDNNIDITFTTNATWEAAVIAVKIGGTALTATDYILSAGNLQLKPSGGNSLLTTAGSKAVSVVATGYNDATITQQIDAGAATKLGITQQPTAPANNGGTLVTQPIVSIQDQYGNTTTNTATVNAAKGDAGSWTLGGITGIPGPTATYNNLTATSIAAVTGATITFTSGILTSTTSNQFNIPAPPTPNYISLTAFNTPATEDFNTLASTGTSSTLPTGWAFFETGSLANTTYTAGTGSGTTGDTYSFGSTSSSDRAFGGLQSGSLIPTIGVSFKNSTGGVMTQLAISFTGEQWRLGATGREDRLDFQYSLNATSLNTGNWTDVDNLDFVAPVTTAPTGALDGNATANRTAKSYTITGLNIADGSVFFIRFSDYNASGADDGLGIDDWSLTAEGILPPTTYTGTGNWSTTGNWSSGIPTSTDNAVVDGFVTIDVAAETNDLTINTGKSVTISATKSLTVNGTLTNSVNSGLIIKSDATGTGSLIHTTTDVNGTVERYIVHTTGSDHGWHFLSSPVASQAIQSGFVPSPPGSGTQGFFSWDEPQWLWINTKDGSGNWASGFETTFIVGKGYLVNYSSDGVTKNFADVLNVTDVSKTGLTRTETNAYPGWNLLGNPFTSALIWNTGWTMTNIAAGAKIWNEGGASYSEVAAGDIIPAAQGFMVEVTSGTGSLTIPAAARTHSDQTWYKSTGNPYIKLKANDLAGQTFQESVITFNTQATTGYDAEFDSHFLPGYAPQFYSVEGEEHLSTNVLPSMDNQTTIPFNFIKNDRTTYTIEAVKIDNVPAQVYLTDLKTNKVQNLTDNNVYSFTSQAGDDPARFLLSFSHVGIETKEPGNNGIYVYNNTVFISNPGESTIEVYNMIGQKIVTEKTQSEPLYQLHLPTVMTSYYIVRLTTGKKVYTEKIFVK